MPDDPERPQDEPVSLSKDGAADGDPSAREPVPGVDFDPYRFGAPEHPIPPEYAPPGYVPPPPTAPPAAPYPGTQPYPGAQQPGSAYPPAPPPWGAQPPQYPGSSQYPGSQYPGSQYPGYPPPSGGYPPPPAPFGGYGTGSQRTGHGKAVTSLVLGIASIVLCWLTVLDAVPVILSLIFGGLALRESRFRGNRDGRGMAIAGIVCAVIGALLAIALTVLIYTRFKDCLDLSPGSADYRTCIQNHL